MNLSELYKLIEARKLDESSSQKVIATVLPADQVLDLVTGYGFDTKYEKPDFKFTGIRNFFKKVGSDEVMPDSVKEYIFGLVKPFLIQYVHHDENLMDMITARISPSQIDALLAEPQVLQKIVSDVATRCTNKCDITGKPNSTYSFLQLLRKADLSDKSFNLLVNQLKQHFMDGSIIKSDSDFLLVFGMRNKLPSDIRESLSRVLLSKAENEPAYVDGAVSLGYSLRDHKDKIVELGSTNASLSSSPHTLLASKDATLPESSATPNPSVKP